MAASVPLAKLRKPKTGKHPFGKESQGAPFLARFLREKWGFSREPERLVIPRRRLFVPEEPARSEVEGNWASRANRRRLLRANKSRVWLASLLGETEKDYFRPGCASALSSKRL